mmetsp:Transcript_114554/g.325076  ORF Transcript_114554/g.325076 Transcript_114554/m.325076 type:complete len:377 (+) Transcript_114554:239-1369(+)
MARRMEPALRGAGHPVAALARHGAPGRLRRLEPHGVREGAGPLRGNAASGCRPVEGHPWAAGCGVGVIWPAVFVPLLGLLRGVELATAPHLRARACRVHRGLRWRLRSAAGRWPLHQVSVIGSGPGLPWPGHRPIRLRGVASRCGIPHRGLRSVVHPGQGTAGARDWRWPDGGPDRSAGHEEGLPHDAVQSATPGHASVRHPPAVVRLPQPGPPPPRLLERACGGAARQDPGDPGRRLGAALVHGAAAGRGGGGPAEGGARRGRGLQLRGRGGGDHPPRAGGRPAVRQGRARLRAQARLPGAPVARRSLQAVAHRDPGRAAGLVGGPAVGRSEAAVRRRRPRGAPGRPGRGEPHGVPQGGARGGTDARASVVAAAR